MTYTYGELHRQLTLALKEFPDNATVTVHMSRDAGEKLAEAVMLADGVQTWYDTAAEKVRVAYEAMRPLIDALTAPQDPPLICEACAVPFDTMLELNAHALWHEGAQSRSTVDMLRAFQKGQNTLHGRPSFPTTIRCNFCDAAFVSAGEASRHSCPGLAARGMQEAGFTAGSRAPLPLAGARDHMCDECGVWFATAAELQGHLEQGATTTEAATADSWAQAEANTWARTRARILADAERNAERLRAPEEEPRSPKPHPGTYKADD